MSSYSWCEYMRLLKDESGWSYADLAVLLSGRGFEVSPSFLCRVFRGARALPRESEFYAALADVLSKDDPLPVFLLADRLPAGMGVRILEAQADAEVAQLRERFRTGEFSASVRN